MSLAYTAAPVFTVSAEEQERTEIVATRIATIGDYVVRTV